jgi:hypothetical protein
MKNTVIPQIIAGVVLLFALNPYNPDGYYIFLRWICCIVFAYTAYQYHLSNKINWLWIMVIMAVIYNPIMKIYLTREIWTLINIVSVIIVLISIFNVKKKGKKRVFF